ncbi:hypothetical protein FLCU109888_04985 [Flavobacterium cucumis]|uniref:TonB-dependent outer membrane receptor, SusC/RagA subfamily, signature region n=1 Tax=Flavobacterium cucumis TaxID=416016 RepID=A0A1M7ZSD7_9FLAO|nr:hypothetical protein [Flavobacterium cucumis]SHO71804.1 TonB-dependent outer membrane receptor, SusC/RagA subfamily, signature region [Flavobacterium cucumis]
MKRQLILFLLLFFMTFHLSFSQDTIITKPKKSTNIINREKPLIVVNDSILKYEVMEYLNPNEIESVTVWKDEKAKSMYGEKGKFGVIIITTKNISKEKRIKIYKEFKDEL